MSWATTDSAVSRTTSARRVAFQGERGAFGEEAIVSLFGDAVVFVPRPTFRSLFAAIDEGAADLLLAPVENSLVGSVQQTHDLLLESSLHITREAIIPIRHCLIGCRGSALEAIETVESHPVALAQCERFFAEHPPIRPIAAPDTAGSVAEIVRRGDPTRAAIAGQLAAQIYGGQILRRHLEDHAENYTRFLLLAASPAGDGAVEADKLSVVVRLASRPGTLQSALEPFARRGLDLLRIETRPVKGEAWAYHFFLDFQTSPAGAEAALAELRERTTSLRLLGAYASARTLPAG